MVELHLQSPICLNGLVQGQLYILHFIYYFKTYLNCMRHFCATFGLFKIGKKNSEVEFDFLRAVVTKSSTFWDVMSYGPVKVNHRFTWRYTPVDRTLQFRSCLRALWWSEEAKQIVFCTGGSYHCLVVRDSATCKPTHIDPTTRFKTGSVRTVCLKGRYVKSTWVLQGSCCIFASK
jgi:hypothetical protein